MPKPLWQPSPERVADSNMTAFVHRVSERTGRTFGGDAFDGYQSLFRWSVECPDAFWEAVWEFCTVIAAQRGDVRVESPERMPGARWFPQARLNFAENLLRRRDGAAALVFRGEDRVCRRVSFSELYDAVSVFAQALRAEGVGPGDRVAAFVPNMPEAIIGMLATTSIGALWSSCSPDFGVQGVLDRFGQIEPKVLISADCYVYNGKTHDSLGKLGEIAGRLPSIERVVVIPYLDAGPDIAGIANAVGWDAFGSAFSPSTIEFAQLPFDHPLYIVYSSGTTGVPKCIVHGAGGSLLQHVKEQQLHADLKRDDRLFYFTTCGWMMWNWLASGLAAGATLLLYDGSPFYPDARVLFDFAEQERVTIFGTSAKYIDALNKSGLEPAASHDLDSLRTILSTGSPLMPESFDFVYRSIKRDVCLSSISGGTDIMGCFVGGCPILPVWRGEIQCAQLGMDVRVWADDGRELAAGEKGELVCVTPFPSMPVEFWNDPDGGKYRAAYFERFPGVWCHGDYVERTGHAGFVMHGRSDTVLNPGGVRIGTAEIYRQAEQVDAVLESLVIGQQWHGDVRIVLFVKLRDGVVLDDTLSNEIKRRIRGNATPRHVPARIVQVSDIPRTKSGKIVELAVRDVVYGRPVKNLEALANPEALELFKNRPELES